MGRQDRPCETPRRAKAVHASLAVGDKATLGSCTWGATGQGPGDTPQKGRRPSNSGAQMATAGLSRDSPGQNTGVGSLSLLQGIFPTQGSNGGLLHCRQILYQLSYQESFMRLRYGVLRKFKTQLSGWIDLLISKKSLNRSSNCRSAVSHQPDTSNRQGADRPARSFGRRGTRVSTLGK